MLLTKSEKKILTTFKCQINSGIKKAMHVILFHIYKSPIGLFGYPQLLVHRYPNK